MLLFSLLLLAGWLTATHISPWVSWHAELPIFVATFGLASLALWRDRHRKMLSFPIVLALPLILLLILGIQWLIGMVGWKGQALVIALYLVLVASSIEFGWREASRCPTSTRQATGEWLAWTVIAACLISHFIAMSQVLEIWNGQSFILRMPFVRRPGANLGQPNHLATLFVTGLAAAAYLQMLGRLTRKMLFGLVLFFCLGIALTESRTGLVAVFVLTFWWAWRNPQAGASISRVWSLFPLITVSIFFIAWPYLFYIWSGGGGGASGAERLMSSGTDARIVLWRQVWDASWMYPWFGWGMRNTAEAHNAVAHLAEFSLPITYAHNIILDMAVWVGWPLTIILTGGSSVWLISRILKVRDSLSWFGMALLIPFGVHSLLEFPYAYAYLLVPAMIGVGYIAANDRETWKLQAPFALVAGFMTLVIGPGVWSVVDYLRVETDYRDARFEMLRIGPPRTSPPPDIQVLDQLGDLLASARASIRPGMAPVELDLLQRAALHNPWSGTQYRFALALALNGQNEEALRQLKVLRAQHGKKAHDVLRAEIDTLLVTHHMGPLPPSDP